MQIIVRKQYKNMEITITGNENDAIAQKLIETVAALGTQEMASQGPATEGLVASESVLESDEPRWLLWVKSEDTGPKLSGTLCQKISSSSIKELQSNAFMVLAYILKIKYDEFELTTNRITSLMKDSGVNTKNIHNTTKHLSGQGYISKTKGERSFKLTPRGEDYAKRILDTAIADLA